MRRSRRHLVRWIAATLMAGVLVAGACSSGSDDDGTAGDGTVDDGADSSTPAADVTDDSLGTDADGLADVPISVFDLEVGTCFDDPAFAADEPGTIGETVAVQCFEPHDAEVYAIVSYTSGPEADFPGEDIVQDRAEDECFDRFEDFVGIAYEDSRLDIATIWPTEDSWEQGDREATCVVFDVANQKLEGTMDGAEL